MAIQFLPIIKALAPYIAQVATSAVPAFTSKPEAAVKVDPLLVKQIEELQSAALQNAESIHVLAEKMQQAIQQIEAAAQIANKQVTAYKTMLFVSFGLSIAAMSACIYLLVR
ncbi:MAG TPA: hypothetical protein VK958_09215 [Methylophilus sp.]|uniref:hypothetical protein n=1 Tax=Methylophilus sp. TaxID=29541 RepID=UPI002C43A3B2|nr:hypothetical protein [Methylophilus sp.]HSH87412.1 hypothetical protein [Methylophilus sp.]